MAGKKGADAMTFTQAMERMKEIVTLLENSSTGLEEGIALYREACACAAVCRARLDEARNVLQDESLLPETGGACARPETEPETAGGPTNEDRDRVPF